MNGFELILPFLRPIEHLILDPEISEEAATAMNTHFTKQRAIAKMKMTTMSTRASKKKPTYELNALIPLEEPPGAREQKRAAEHTPPGENNPPGDDQPPGKAGPKPPPI